MPRRKLRVVSRKAKSTGLTSLQKKSVKRIAKNVAMTIPEKKVFGFNAENQQLIHNKGAYLTSWLKCKQGTGDPNDQADQLVRIGDEYYLRNVNVRFWLSNKEDRPNVMYKCFLFWYDSNFTLSDATCFFTQTNKMLDRINNENISIIDQQTIFSGPSYSGTEREHSYLCTLKGKWKSKKIIYDEGGTSPKKRDIGTCVVCYDAFGTLQTDNIASYAYNGTVTIQDP
jgi:hypothetical protein